MTILVTGATGEKVEGVAAVVLPLGGGKNDMKFS